MMDEESREILSRIKENDDNLIKLYIRNEAEYEFQEGIIFNSSDGNDFTKLGQYIAKNTHLTTLNVYIPSLVSVDICQGFHDGLQYNSSICRLCLESNNHNFGSLGG